MIRYPIALRAFVRSLLLAPLVAGRVAAQEPDTARVAPVVVTATRVPLSIVASPIATYVITGEELRLQGMTHLAQALQQVPGVALAQTGSFGGTTALFLRGGESKYVKVLVDGVPVNEPGGAFDFATLTLDNVERIEVARGPTSVLYGADAVTGVVQIFTRRGAGPFRATLSARAGGYDSRDVEASLSGSASGADLSAAVARHETDGIYAFNSAYESSVASGAVRFAPDDRTELRLALRYTDHRFHYPTTGSGAVVDSNAFRAEDRTSISLEGSRRLAPAVALHLALASHHNTGGTDDRPQANRSSLFVSLDDVRRRGANLWADFALPASGTFTVGVQAEQQDQRSQSQSESSGFEFNSLFDAERSNRAAYAQVVAPLGSALVLTAGARHDDNERFGGFTTHRVGASWRPFAATRLRASTGTGFREPTFFENYATGFVTGNPNLEPERSTSWEAGLQQSVFGERLTVGATYFHQVFRDLIDYAGSTDACGASYCNVARVRSSGQELEAALALPAGVRVDASLTHLDTRVLRPGFDVTSGGLYREGESLVRRPRTSWNLGAAWRRSRGGLDVRITHVGERGDRDFSTFPASPVVLDDHTLVDVGGELSVLRAVTLTVRAENVGDTEYTSVYGFLAPRRRVLFGARASF